MCQSIPEQVVQIKDRGHVLQNNNNRPVYNVPNFFSSKTKKLCVSCISRKESFYFLLCTSSGRANTPPYNSTHQIYWKQGGSRHLSRPCQRQPKIEPRIELSRGDSSCRGTHCRCDASKSTTPSPHARTRCWDNHTPQPPPQRRGRCCREVPNIYRALSGRQSTAVYPSPGSRPGGEGILAREELGQGRQVEAEMGQGVERGIRKRIYSTDEMDE